MLLYTHLQTNILNYLFINGEVELHYINYTNLRYIKIYD